jgi:hypothetical protein
VFKNRENFSLIMKGGSFMTKKYNKGSKNQNSPELHGQTPVSGDNSKGNKRNVKEHIDKTDDEN